jgi:FkbM family methyltransferase
MNKTIQALRNIINHIRLNIRSFLRKIILRYSVSQKKVVHLRKQVNCNYQWYGSSYGGFYVNPDFLNEKSIIYSFGIGKDITFDIKCINKHRCQVYGFDPTPKSIQWISSQRINPLFVFNNYGISTISGYQDFFLPSNPKGVSGSLVHSEVVNVDNSIKVLMKSFNDITSNFGHKLIDVVKIDIEGSEYEIIDDIINSTCVVNQILVEFHDRLFNSGASKSKGFVEKMNQKGYFIFAVSGSYEEVSFIKKDLLNT